MKSIPYSDDNDEDHDYMNCQCGSGQEKEAEYDARGIFLTYACDKCRKEKLSRYRQGVLDDPQYWSDEPIDEDY